MAVIKRPRHHYLMQLTRHHPSKLILFPAYEFTEVIAVHIPLVFYTSRAELPLI